MSQRRGPSRKCTYEGCSYSSNRPSTLKRHRESHCTEPGCAYLVQKEYLLNHHAAEHPYIFRAHTGKNYSFKPVPYGNNGSVKNTGWPKPNAWPRKRTLEENKANTEFMNALKADGRNFGTAVSPTGARTRRGSFFEVQRNGGSRRTRRIRRTRRCN